MTKEDIQNTTFPSGLQSLILGHLHHDYTNHEVMLPERLLSLRFGDAFDESLHNVRLPKGLQSLTLGYCFNQRMDTVILPRDLKTLTFGEAFNQNIDNLTLPKGLQSLTFGEDFNQSMKNVTLPSDLNSLTFGEDFNQSIQTITLPSGLKSLVLGGAFIQSMDDDTRIPAGFIPSGGANCTVEEYAYFSGGVITCTLCQQEFVHGYIPLFMRHLTCAHAGDIVDDDMLGLLRSLQRVVCTNTACGGFRRIGMRQCNLCRRTTVHRPIQAGDVIPGQIQTV